MEKIMISGYYGFDNAGDEAILAGILHSLRKKRRDLQFIVLSASPAKTAARYNVTAIGRYDILSIIKGIHESSLFISGGGSLLQDVTGQKTIPYYLGLVFMARLLQTKTVLYAQGIGPVNHIAGKKLINWLANRVDAISVRDIQSRNLLIELGVRKGLIKKTVDPVFALYDKINNHSNYKSENEKKVPVIGVSIRPWNDNNYIDKLARGIDKLQKKTAAEIYILPMYYGEDLLISRKIQERLHCSSYLIEKEFEPISLMKYFNRFDFFIGVRLHSLIFAAINRVPFFALSYDPKVANLLKSFSLNTIININCKDEIRYANLIKKSWEERRKNRKIIESKLNEFYLEAINQAGSVLEII